MTSNDVSWLEKQALLSDDDVSSLKEDAGKTSPRSSPSRKSVIVKIMLGALALCVLSSTPIIAFAIAPQSAPSNAGALQASDYDTAKSSVCTSAGCVLAAAELLYSMSPNYKQLDPCNDFHTYVCEGFEASHDIPADRDSVSSLNSLSDKAMTTLRHILESSSPENVLGGSDPSAIDKENFRKLQDGYQSCMNEDHLRTIGAKPLLDLIADVSKLYHSKDESDSKRLNDQQALITEGNGLSKALAYLTSLETIALVGLGVGADDKHPDHQVVQIMPAFSIGLPAKEYYKDERILKAYHSTAEQVLQGLLNSTWTSGSAELMSTNKGLKPELVYSLMDFEKKLAAIMPDLEDLFDPEKSYNPMPLEQADALISQISLRQMVKTFRPDVEVANVIVLSPVYLKALSQVLDDTSSEVVHLFLIWKTIQSFQGYIEADELKPLTQLNNVLRGRAPDVKGERWRKCVAESDGNLGWILSRFYVSRAFSPEAKEFGDRIIMDIKNSFVHKLRASTWMTPDVQEKGVEKVHNIIQKIGYPTQSPNLTSPADLASYYSDVTINATTFFANTLSSVRSSSTRSWAQLGKPTDKNEWGMTASTVNAYYNPPGNEIVFPAGIMQAPVFYDPSVPSYLSYGAFGAVAGHELSHAFDSSGRNYDENGTLSDWWDDKTVAAFKTKAECFVEQYHNFTVPDRDGTPLHLNGRLKLGENIADAGGVAAAFASWKMRDGQKADMLLPGLQDFSKEQLFFLSYANTWCGKSRPQRDIDGVYNDPHSPPKYRILGTMANSREFREAFSCPVKEPTCELW